MDTITKRKFGKITAEFYNHNNGIRTFTGVKLSADYFSNYGCIYVSSLPRYFAGETGTQVFGFETSNGLNKTVKAWLYKTLEKLYRKNLIV